MDTEILKRKLVEQISKHQIIDYLFNSLTHDEIACFYFKAYDARQHVKTTRNYYIATEWVNGKSQKQVASKYGISAPRVREILLTVIDRINKKCGKDFTIPNIRDSKQDALWCLGVHYKPTG